MKSDIDLAKKKRLKFDNQISAVVLSALTLQLREGITS